MDIHRFSSRKRKQVRRACLNCQKAHSGCGEQRPCPRCVKRKEEHKCIDAPRRKRKDLPDSEEEEEEITFNEQPAVTCNKRKRKLEQAAPQTSAAMATRNAALVKTERHRHPHADTDSHDEDYEDDCCSNSSPVSTSAALVVRNTKRPRRASRWPSTTQPAFSNNTLSFPFDLKQEKDEELACGYGSNTQHQHQHQHPHQHNNMDNLGVMGQMQQQVLSQKLSFYNMQPATQYIQRQPTQTQQPTYGACMPKEEDKNCNFIFNPTEFDCVQPQRQPICEPTQQQQPQPQLYDNNNDLSLEWLVPELNLWGTTTTATTTTTITAPSYAWTGMPEQIPSSFLMEEGTFGSGEENPLFFSDYRTFEPLFSF